MSQLGLTIIMLWNIFHFGFAMPQDGAQDTNDMTELCYGIDRQILCDCSPSETQIGKASCALFYKPVPDDPMWIQLGLNPTLTTLRIYSRPEGLLTFMPTKAFNPNVLTDVTIEYANITTVPSFTFRNSTVINLVTLSNNNILSLEPYAFAHLPSLSELFLNENSIKIIKKNTFVQLSKLEILMLDRNLIEVIEDGTFFGLNRLQELSLTGNALQDLRPGLFKGLFSLKNLDLGKNKIRHLRSSCFVGLPKIRVIDLRENEISFIDARTFEELPNLMTLYLSRNKLTNLHQDTFQPLTSLEYLDLRQNNLKTLTERTIMTMNLHNTSNAYLLVKENAFVCDCKLRWMLKMSTMRNSTEWTTVKCLSPGEDPNEADPKKPLVADFNIERDFHVQANEKHINLRNEILLSDAKAFLENCPDVQKEEDLDKGPSKSFALEEEDKYLVGKSPKVAPVESVSMGLTKTSTTVPSPKVTGVPSTQSLPHNAAGKSRNLLTANLMCYLLFLLL